MKGVGEPCAGKPHARFDAAAGGNQPVGQTLPRGTGASRRPDHKYRDEAQYPDGQLYNDYMAVLEALLKQVGGKILWRTNVLGHVVGNQDIDEALGIWYPTHQAFLNLMTAPASSENMRLRALAVAHADLHRCEAY